MAWPLNVQRRSIFLVLDIFYFNILNLYTVDDWVLATLKVKSFFLF